MAGVTDEANKTGFPLSGELTMKTDSNQSSTEVINVTDFNNVKLTKPINI